MACARKCTRRSHILDISVRVLLRDEEGPKGHLLQLQSEQSMPTTSLQTNNTSFYYLSVTVDKGVHAFPDCWFI
jgi:hypothetical protein